MALRLRRGTDSERQLITPVEGELIYTTDTKLLYAGDGTTAGGTLVTGAGGGGGSTTLAALTDTDLTGASNNDVLTYNSGTSKWESTGLSNTLDLNDLTDVYLPGAAYNGDALVFDGSSWTARPIADFFDEQQNYKINIVGDDSTIMLNTDNNEVIGATITATNKFIGDLTGNVTGNVTGFHAGTFDGDLTGSVFGDDSSLIIDGINNTVNMSLARIESIVPYVANTPVIINNSNRTPLQIKSVTTGTLGGYPYLDINSVKGSLVNPISIVAGEVAGAWKITGYVDETTDASAIVGVGSFASTATMTDDSPESVFTLVTGGGGTSFNLFNFDHTGQFIAPGPVTPGVFADPTARDAAITTPAAGMIVFLTDSTGASGAAKHQGYDGSSWNDLY